MKPTQINEQMIGKRYEGMYQGVQIKGEITRIERSRFTGETFVHVHFDEPTKFWEADERDEIMGGSYREFKGASLTEQEFNTENVIY